MSKPDESLGSMLGSALTGTIGGAQFTHDQQKVDQEISGFDFFSPHMNNGAVASP